MRWQDIYIDAVAAVLGEPADAARAVADGRYDAEEAARSRQRSVSESREPAPDLAVRAGRSALERSGRPASDIGMLIHANCWDQGVDFWSAASYIQRALLGHGDVLAFEIGQMSNGGMCAIELAAAHLTAVPALAAALLTTGDRFAEPRFRRWSLDRGLVYGDAGTAMVLSRRPGPLRLLASATHSVPALERLHRGDDLHTPPAGPQPTLDLAARKRRFFAEMPPEEVTARNSAGMMTAVKHCLADADTDLADLTTVVTPFFGTELTQHQCLEPLGIRPEDTLLDYGLGTGHLGAGDQFAGLAHLVGAGSLAPDHRILLISTGAGFNWSCAVVQATGPDVPR
jgi:3-oxoacyl-[acyl-carrier-protein] synthase-3